ncbi:metacaspase-1-like [Actinidia eriantha]|uniref:metacaspase-1-like n=1 Tax=Actinidia eriantha TaxID=165200 RepID=UPI0025896FB0|nr:metacaspase-1-like [Actinidia eriantha]
MESIVCSNCNSQVLGTPFSVNYRCRSCQAMISTQQCETLSKGALRLHLMTRFYRSRSPSSMSPKPNQKPNPVSFAAGHQQKKALLCGVSYEKKNHKLKGTVNDVNRMKCLLVDLYGFPVNAIHVLTEEKNNTDLSPTKKNIQKALSWLVEDCKSGDSLVFYFSGHGLRQPDFNGDELDGYDETICPSDFMTAGMIFDNYINTTIVKPLKEGVKLHAIIDACHSGTILDLEHVYNLKKKRWEDNKPPSGARKCTNGGLAISLSACADDQMAADTAAFTGNEMSGALTYIFVQTIRENPQITYGDLLNEMKEKMELANRKGCLNSPFLKKLFHCNLMQECQLSSSKEFDVNAEQFNI